MLLALLADCSVDVYFGSPTVPLGCPVSVYSAEGFDLKLRALRDDQPVDVFGNREDQRTYVPAKYETDYCTHESFDGSFELRETFVELAGAVEGDVLTIDYSDARAVVVAAAECTDVPPTLMCPSDDVRNCCPPDPYDEPGCGGCSGGGAPSLLVALLLLRRRQRCADNARGRPFS